MFIISHLPVQLIAFMAIFVIQDQIVTSQVSYWTSTIQSVTSPLGIAVNQRTGEVFAGSSATGTIHKISADGSIVNTYLTGLSAGTGTACHDMAVNAETGTLYVLDGLAHTIYEVPSGSGGKSVLAGLPGVSGNSDGIGTVARLNLGPWSACGGLDFDILNNELVLAETGNNQIRTISTSGLVVTIPVSGGQSLISPRDITVNPRNGYKYFTDEYRIWEISSSGTFTVIAGSTLAGSANGPASSARFLSYGITFDIESNGLYLAETANHLIRFMNLTSMQVSTVAGSGTVNVDGAGLNASLAYPDFIVSDANGNLFIAEYGNNQVRKLSICFHDSSFNATIKRCVYDSCPAGYQLSYGNCIKCPPGQYKTSYGSISCRNCPIGEEPNSLQTDCTACSTGVTFRPSLTYPTCINCPQNAICNTNYNFTCEPGYFISEDGNQCLSCPNNEQSNLDRTVCSPCVSGQYFSVSTKECTVCPTGASCDGISFTCNAGYAPTLDGLGCSQCEEGYSKSVPGNLACTQCLIGQESAADMQSCIACVSGTYRSSTVINKCIPCPSGATCNANAITRCANGFKLNANSNGCDQCPVGQSSTDGLNCNLCQSGSAKPSQIYVECFTCPNGGTCAGSSVSCPIGHFFDSSLQCKRNDTFFSLLQTGTVSSTTVTEYVTLTQTSTSTSMSFTFMTATVTSQNVRTIVTTLHSVSVSPQARAAASDSVDLFGALPISPLALAILCFGSGVIMMLVVSLLCFRTSKSRIKSNFDNTSLTTTMNTSSVATYTNETLSL